jgi:hypothetical protein
MNTETIKKHRGGSVMTLKLGVLVGVAVAFGVVGQSAAVLESFDNYSVNTEISGIGNWASTTYPAKVSAAQSVSAPNSGHFSHLTMYDALWYGKLNLAPDIRRLEFDVFLTACPIGSQAGFHLQDIDEGYIGIFESVELVDNWCQIRGRKSGDWETIGTMPLNTWRTFIFEQSTTTAEVRYSIDGGINYTAWLPASLSTRDIRRFFISFANIYNEGYVDNITHEAIGEIRVWGVSPASGGTTTSTDTNISIGWEGWDFEDIYKDFVFSFREKNTGILTGTKIFAPTTTAGTYTLPLSDFGISKNGNYYLHAKARSYLYEYTAYYTGDLVSPEWWINVNVEGWEAIFEMPATSTWYAAHSKFATPTAGFLTITNFLTPIYNKLGEFGNRAIEFLNIEEAYDRGYDLGKIIPTYTQYITGIEVFFGGFPIIQIFTAFLAVLLGIFIGRLILKFVPFIGK